MQFDWTVVAIAAFLNVVIGFFWYSKWLFGGQWLKLVRLSEKDLKGANMSIFYGVCVSLLTAVFLAIFEAYLGVTTVTDGMFVGFCIWLGFILTTQLNAVIWAKSPFKLFLIDTGYKLFSFIVMGGILGA